MTRNAAKSVLAAERRALDGENESQDSQARLLFLIQTHGVGMMSSSPIPDNHLELSNSAHEAPPTSYPHLEACQQTLNFPQIDAALDAKVCPSLTNADIDPVVESVPSGKPSTQKRPSTTNPQDSSSNCEHGDVPVSTEQHRHDVPSLDQPSLVTHNDAHPQPRSSTAASKPRTQNMSSQSPTQSNEGRSYEQYANNTSQALTQDSTTEEHRTLHEGDAGYVNLRHSFSAGQTDPNPPDTPFTRDERSMQPSQLASAYTDHFAPETPAVFAKPFFNGGHGQILGGTQLFGQTQPTSGLRKPSPTSSRPSPNIFENNAISPTLATSSPLKDRGFGTTPLAPFASTSPGFPERSSRPSGRTPPRSPALANADEGDDSNNEELPSFNSYVVRKNREPKQEFHPYKRKSSDAEIERPSSHNNAEADSSQDEAEFRRRRANLRKEKASKSFPDISVPSSGKAKVEVPSTNRAKRVLERTVSDQYRAQCYGKHPTDNDSTQDTVADSQDAMTPQQQSHNAGTVLAEDPRPLEQDDEVPPPGGRIGSIEKELIPETSPACTFIEQPRPFGDFTRNTSNASSGFPSLSLPSLGESDEVPGSQKTTDTKQEQAAKNPETLRGLPKGVLTAPRSSPSLVLASSQQRASRRSTRPSQVATPSSTAPDNNGPETGTSSLTVLSATPVLSSSTTPETDDTGRNDQPKHSVSVSSPAAAKRQRRGRPTSSLPTPTVSVTGSNPPSRSRDQLRKASRRFSRHNSMSTDELARSPSVSGADIHKPETRKVTRKSVTAREFEHGIFDKMIFVISIPEETQNSKTSADKSLSKIHVETAIRQNGGRILEDGFDALFKYDRIPTNAHRTSIPVLSSLLRLIDPESGFTALIANRHSRKVKYMQALALGIPCLAPQWITTCLAKKEIVDWSSYLLCAGPSVLLGNAIRSRNLSPYDASTAKLIQVIAQRPKLLDESKILLVMKKKNEVERLPYVFLTQVLGASLVRVHSLKEARNKLREAEDEDDHFDWVYVDDALQDARSVLFGTTAVTTVAKGVTKKRKRTSTITITEQDDDRPPKRIRALNDELVVQSLILGRLIEEDEMKG
ncbi:hypothetical protein F5Y16DRAFT_404401 [Xylariaceae sp. FL0255]|nr:hypothetical protein F5Y16DRAFT_404401 [Xylariaceae sp. FL0255]